MTLQTTPKIRIRGLSKAFGEKQVLDGIDLDVAAGTSMVVIGGSGSGKSVLLKCILGLIEPDAGSIELDGRNVLALPRHEAEAARAAIGMLFQGAALFDSLPVWENVAFGLLARGAVSRAEARRRAGAILASVGLDPSVGDLSPAELSGGMQKRVGLARAIAGQPDILFFDEPTTGLDPIMGAVIDGLIVDCVKRWAAPRSPSPTTWPAPPASATAPPCCSAANSSGKAPPPSCCTATTPWSTNSPTAAATARSRWSCGGSLCCTRKRDHPLSGDG